MNSITMIFLLSTFLCISCSTATEQNSAFQNNPISVQRLDTLEIPVTSDSILFIDTILPLMGSVKVYLKDNDLYFRGERVNKRAKLRDETQFLNGKKEYPTNLINVFDNGKWLNQSIVNIGDSLVVFVLRNDEHIPHFYSVKCTDDSCVFLCSIGAPACAIFSRTASCVVMDKARKRLMVMPNGVSSDIERDVEYHSVYVYQLGNRTIIDQGVLKYEIDWSKKDFLDCENQKDIERWFLPYLRIADRHIFDDYLKALPLK